MGREGEGEIEREMEGREGRREREGGERERERGNTVLYLIYMQKTTQ